MNIFGLFQVDGWIIILLLLLAVSYWYLNKPYRVFDELGIPCPKSYPIIGHLPYLFMGMLKFDLTMIKKYGKIFGTYATTQPMLILSDPDLIKQVFVKDTQHFTNRGTFDFGNDILNKSVSLLKGQQWKMTRSILTPTFSASKIKKMMPLINGSTDYLAQSLLKMAEENIKFEAKDIYGKLTMDVIAKTMFGLEVDCQRDDNIDFVRYAKDAFKISFTSPKLLISIFLPGSTKYMKMLGINLFDPKMIDFFTRTIKEVIGLRQRGQGKYNDFVQLMLNAHIDHEFVKGKEDGGGDEKENVHAKGLTDDEILAQSLIFFLAGYETTASLLAWATYCLAANPAVQDRLREEIQDKLQDREEVTYDDVHEMPYLDMVVNEVLRMHPPLLRFDRVLSVEDGEDYYLGGYKLPPNVNIQVPVYHMHHNEEWWDEPYEFRPERFSAEAKAARNPYVFAPWGIGPRNCIGMRFALVEAKAALVAALRSVKFTLAPQTPARINPLTTKLHFQKTAFFYVEEGLWIVPHKL